MSVNPIVLTSQLIFLNNAGILPAFTHAAEVFNVDRNILLAIASRESNMGIALADDWTGDFGSCGATGCGMGIMQIDRRYHKDFAATTAPNDHFANVLKAASILKKNIHTFDGNLKAAIAAYNAGPGSVRSALNQGLDPDLFTTGQDYARDVLSRYQMIKSLGGADEIGDQLKNVLATTIIAGLSGAAYMVIQNPKLLSFKN